LIVTLAWVTRSCRKAISFAANDRGVEEANVMLPSTRSLNKIGNVDSEKTWARSNQARMPGCAPGLPGAKTSGWRVG